MAQAHEIQDSEYETFNEDSDSSFQNCLELSCENEIPSNVEMAQSKVKLSSGTIATILSGAKQRGIYLFNSFAYRLNSGINYRLLRPKRKKSKRKNAKKKFKKRITSAEARAWKGRHVRSSKGKNSSRTAERSAGTAQAALKPANTVLTCFINRAKQLGISLFNSFMIKRKLGTSYQLLQEEGEHSKPKILEKYKKKYGYSCRGRKYTKHVTKRTRDNNGHYLCHKVLQDENTSESE